MNSSQSLLSRKNLALFLLANVIISAFTAWLITRAMTGNLTVTNPTPVATIAASATQKSSAPTTSVALPVTPPNVATAIPQPSATSAPTNTPAPNPTARLAKVVISTVSFPGQRLREQVVFANEGDQINLNGWSIKSSNGNTYAFKNVSIAKDGFLNLYTTNGSDTSTALFMNRAEPAWVVGDSLTLLNAEGQTVNTYVVK